MQTAPRVLAGKYRLEAQLRAGTTGAIYRAHHLTLDKTVCIKILHPELAKVEPLALRFHREARAASRIEHPSSIHVLDYGADVDGTLFIAMELVDGRDLFEMIDEAAASPGGIGAVFPPRRIVDLLSQVLAALAAAHDVGILHRDLKPENIMVTSTRDDGDRVKVCDFGVARIDEPPESGRRLTRRGFILGTPEYMSPEQARAESVDARSDVYSAGMVLYHLLTGRVPFEDDSPIVVALMQINEAPRRPSELRPDVSPPLEAVCLKAIEKDPAKRYASAREMRAALRDAVARPTAAPLPLPAVQVPAERVSSLPAVEYEAPRPRSKRAFVVVATLLVAAAAGGTWRLSRMPMSVSLAAAPVVAEIAKSPAAKLAPEAPAGAGIAPGSIAVAKPAPLSPAAALAAPEPVVVAEAPAAAPPRKVASARDARPSQEAAPLASAPRAAPRSSPDPASPPVSVLPSSPPSSLDPGPPVSVPPAVPPSSLDLAPPVSAPRATPPSSPDPAPQMRPTPQPVPQTPAVPPISPVPAPQTRPAAAPPSSPAAPPPMQSPPPTTPSSSPAIAPSPPAAVSSPLAAVSSPPVPAPPVPPPPAAVSSPPAAVSSPLAAVSSPPVPAPPSVPPPLAIALSPSPSPAAAPSPAASSPPQVAAAPLPPAPSSPQLAAMP